MSNEYNFDDFEGTLNPIGLRNSTFIRKNRPIRMYVYKKEVAYPFSFVGSSSYLISKNLGIPQKEAGLLLIAKINEVLRSVEDAAIKDVLTLRVKRIQTAIEPTKPKKCVNCRQSFYPKRKRQQRCNKCISSVKKEFV